VFTARYALSPYIKHIRFVFKGLNGQLPRYVKSLPCQVCTPKPYMSTVHEYMSEPTDLKTLNSYRLNNVIVEHVFLPVLRFSPVTIIPPMLHTHLHLRVTLTRKTNRQSLGTFQQALLFRKTGSKFSLFFAFKALSD
jgi:hypothetical protein